ncbi:MAG: methyltransferase family protein, partial [Candidatus Eiseniibacteriota bacterium]
VVQLLRDDRDEVSVATRDAGPETQAPAGTTVESATAAAPAPDSWIVRAGHFLFGTRNFLFPLVFVAVALATKPMPFLGSERADGWMDLAGFLVALAGQALRVVVIGLAYIRRGGKGGKIYADTLVVEGFFAHSRNPLYLGNLMVFAGLLIALNSPAGWIVGAPFYLFAYHAITRAEESFLGRKFGAAYEDYKKRVNRFLPSLAGLGATVRGMRFDWRRVVLKEYGATFAWITTFLGVILWEHVAWGGSAGLASVLRPVGIAWVVALVGYATARFLKKTGRLRPR